MIREDARPYEVLIAAMGGAVVDFARDRRLQPRLAPLGFRASSPAPRHPFFLNFTPFELELAAGFGVVAP